jgi:hypothetical protein
MSKLFDDESDEEYQAKPVPEAEANPVSQEQPAATEDQTYSYDQQPATQEQTPASNEGEYNPYAQPE